MTRFFKLKSTALFVLLLTCTNTFAQTTMQKAWQAFFDNKRNDARTLFNQELQQNPNSEHALLALSLLAQTDRAPAEAFSYFQKFCAVSKNPQPYIYTLWMTPSINESFGKKSAAQLAFFKQLTQKPEYDGLIAAIASSMTGKHYEELKQYAKADAEYKNLGSVDSWQITGEFENISTSGFDRTYPVLDNPGADAVFTTKDGAKVGWHPVTAIRHDKWFDFTYYASAGNSIVFAQTFANAPAATEAQLRIGVSGSVKVWVNDALILSEPEERNNDLDTYIQTIKLNAGYNRVLVQIGESYAGNSNFLVRITDDKGHVLPLTYSATPQNYTKETAYKSKKIELFGITFFEDAIKANPDDYLAKILLSQAYLRNDKTFEARRVIEQLRVKYPNSTFLNLLLLNVFNREENRTGAETLKESIKNTDPESPEGLTYKFQELFQQKDYVKALALADQMQQKYPHLLEYVYMIRISIAGSDNKQDEVVKLGEEAYTKFPDNKQFVNLKYTIEKEVRKNAKALNILKKYVDNNDDYGMAKDLSDAYFAAGDAASGLKILQDEINNKPYATGVFATLGNQYFDLQKYDKAEEYYLNCVRIAPTISSYYSSLGKINEMAGRKSKAVDYYKKALTFYPNDYQSIKSLRTLQDKKDVFSYFEEDAIEDKIRKAPKAADYPEDDVVVLNDEVQKVVYEQGGSEERHLILVKVLTQKGVENWKEYDIGYDGWQNLLIETTEVIKANGSKVPAERNENSLVFTNLEVGDILNIRYKIKNYSKAKLAGYFWDSYYFSNGLAHVISKYSLLISKNQKFTHKFSLKPVGYTNTPVDEFDLHVWKNENQPSLQYEDKMPPLDDVANILHVTSLPDWKFISDWYNDLATAKARTNYEVKQVVSGLFEGAGNLTPLQKVQKIYEYITSTISYSSVSFRQSGLIPQNPSDVLNTRIGDCKDVSTLFLAMCKEAGIKAHLVLVKTHNNGVLGMPLPSIDFNHCIAKVNLDNQEHYLELTSPYLPFRSLYNSSLNSIILDIGNADAKSTIKYLDPPNRKANNVKREVNMVFNGKDATITEKAYKTAALAASMRENLSEVSEKDRLKGMKEAIASVYPDVDIIKLKYTKEDRASRTDTVYMDLVYGLKNFTKSIGGMAIFTLPWSSKVSAGDLQVNPPRYSGIDLTQMFGVDNDTETIVVNITLGKSMVESIAPVSIKNEFIEYSITPKQTGNKLALTRTFKLKKDFVPVDKTDMFNEVFKQIVEADSKELAMK